MAKSIILCFDGTCNQPRDAASDDDGISNVLKLHLMLGGDLQDGRRFDDQLSLYMSGVGTHGNKLQRIYNATLAPKRLEVKRILKDARQRLKRNHEPGDRIFVFGFSRGAALARLFISELKKRWKTGEPPRVRFLGAFDTVASFGAPNLDDEDKPVSDVFFENGTISPLIDEALHLVSLDDRRKAFMPTLMNRDDRVTEVWFAGAHSDVGGGYHEDGLSDNVLQFMLEELERRQLGLQLLGATEVDYDHVVPAGEDYRLDLDDLQMEPDPEAVDHVQDRPPVSSAVTLTTRELRVNVKDKRSKKHLPIVHWSVGARIQGERRRYKPKALSRRKHLVLEPDGTTTEYAGLQQHLIQRGRHVTTLAVDEPRELVCHAAHRYNATGILLEKGGQYLFDVAMNQRWKDGDIDPCDANGWTSDQAGWMSYLFVKAAEGLRRVPEANWFALCGSVAPQERELFVIMNHTDTPYVPRQSGELCTFANDLLSKYGNNKGRMKLTVRRVG